MLNARSLEATEKHVTKEAFGVTKICVETHAKGCHCEWSRVLLPIRKCSIFTQIHII